MPLINMADTSSNYVDQFAAAFTGARGKLGQDDVLQASQLSRIAWAELLDDALLGQDISPDRLVEFRKALEACRNYLSSYAQSDKATHSAVQRTNLYLHYLTLLTGEEGPQAVATALQSDLARNARPR